MTLMARRRMLGRFSARPASGMSTRIREARMIEGGGRRAPRPRREKAGPMRRDRFPGSLLGPGQGREGSGDRSCEARDRRAPVGKGSKR